MGMSGWRDHNRRAPGADRAARGGPRPTSRPGCAQNCAVTAARTASGDPGVMLLLLCAFGL
jgi:hypothetical protein